MELLVAALAVLGYLAILVRFLLRDAAGRVRLPRIVDQSIGMWVLREAMAQRRGGDPWEDEVGLGPDRSSLGTPGATPGAQAPRFPAATPIHLAASRSIRLTSVGGERPTGTQPGVAPAASRQSRALHFRPTGAYRRAFARVVQSLGSVVALTTVLVVGFVLIGAALRPTPSEGKVLAITGTPAPSPRSTATPVTADTSAPTAAIAGLSKKPIAGSTLVRVTVTWTLNEAGSGVRSQVLQRRIDNGAWETVALPSSTTRSLTQRLPRGHKYTFRVRGVDRSGNVGPFASRFLYI